MNTKMYLVEMPGDWKGNIDNCPLLEHGCGEFGQCKDGCPIANAKEAVEVAPHDEAYYHPGRGWRVNGKPVRLWATEDK